jgi:hypothetical protein
MTGSLLSTLFISLLAQTGDHPAEPIAVPGSVMDVLQRNAAELSGLEFVTTAARRSLVRAAELPEQLQFITTSDFAAMETYHVAIDKNRFYSRANATWMGKEQEGERTFDGRKLYSGRPPTSGVESILGIDTSKGRLEEASQTGFLKRHFFWEYFPEAG